MIFKCEFFRVEIFFCICNLKVHLRLSRPNVPLLACTKGKRYFFIFSSFFLLGSLAFPPICKRIGSNCSAVRHKKKPIEKRIVRRIVAARDAAQPLQRLARVVRPRRPRDGRVAAHCRWWGRAPRCGGAVGRGHSGCGRGDAPAEPGRVGRVRGRAAAARARASPPS